jgi:hypothetical protein
MAFSSQKGSIGFLPFHLLAAKIGYMDGKEQGKVVFDVTRKK